MNKLKILEINVKDYLLAADCIQHIILTIYIYLLLFFILMLIINLCKINIYVCLKY